MRYFFVDTLGDLDDPQLCVLDGVPEGIGAGYSNICRGRPIAAEYPADAKIHMSPDRSGLKLASLIGNTNSFLQVHRSVKDVIAAQHDRRGTKWQIEYLPFVLINHKGRAHSSDYFLVNPIGAVDCVDRSRSVIRYFKGNMDKVVGIDRLVLDPDKLRDAPPLFRIKEAIDEYVVDETLKAAFEEHGFTNLILKEIEQSPSAAS
jgi:hypothetical protein